MLISGFAQQSDHQPHGGARGKVRGLPKSLGFILSAPWMSVQSDTDIKELTLTRSDSEQNAPFQHQPRLRHFGLNVTVKSIKERNEERNKHTRKMKFIL